jgi:hypothetical protein
MFISFSRHYVLEPVRWENRSKEVLGSWKAWQYGKFWRTEMRVRVWSRCNGCPQPCHRATVPTLTPSVLDWEDTCLLTCCPVSKSLNWAYNSPSSVMNGSQSFQNRARPLIWHSKPSLSSQDSYVPTATTIPWKPFSFPCQLLCFFSYWAKASGKGKGMTELGHGRML